jgi:O-antigen/teichoic acid export membrane protein
MFPMGWFGVYSVAITFAELPRSIISRLSQKVVFPLVSQFSSYPRDELREKIRVPRGKILPWVAVGLAFFGSFSDIAIRILYDTRYDAAAWMLPMLAFGMWPIMLLSTIDTCLLSIGNPRYMAYGNLAKFAYMLVAIPLLVKLWGAKGAILAVALNDIPSYIITNYGLRKERLSFLRQDAWATAIVLGATAVLLGARLALGFGFPGDPISLFGR